MADSSVKEHVAVKSSKNAQLELNPEPEYIQYRIDLFNKLKAIKDEQLANQPRCPISITLKDGSVREGTAWDTSPLDIAKSISKSLADRTVIAKVDGELWDLPRPLESSCKLELLEFDSDEAKKVYWHSSAHILGEACERRFGCHLCIGPPLEDGFYYEMGMPENKVISQTEYQPLEKIAQGIIKEKQPFERLLLEKNDLLEMFKHNRFKQHLIQSKIPDGTCATVYRCGPLIDLCRGPHVPHTGRIKALAILKNSSSYFLGDANNESLQRIYGISFPDNKQLTEYKQFLAEAAKRDHRKIGRDQELFIFHEWSPGGCFFLPHGARIYNTLIDFIKGEYRKRGFQEVITPNLYNTKLWETSGHWQNYREDMFQLDVEKEPFALKPMNCPGHCLMFGHRERSYRELPIRFADFGVLHRKEASGALSGLVRLFRFQQDDAHIFCRVDQLDDEIASSLAFLRDVYGVFGFTFQLKLSTRPEKFLGDIKVWDNAEKILEDALNKFGDPWTVDPGDGAFYGPKIDITIFDALKRKHQCATFQLDFQLPERFGLQYRSSEGSDGETFQRPVIIHRAILGSVERMIAILTENFAGKWPLWLSPRQVVVIPVSGVFNQYAEKVRKQLWGAGLYADADLGDNTLNKKIRNAEIAQYNFVFVVGAEEESTNTVNVRCRDDSAKSKGETQSLEKVLNQLLQIKAEKRLSSKFTPATENQ